MPRMRESHTGANIALELSGILNSFNIRDRVGYAITDNASENQTCLDVLSDECLIDYVQRHVLYMGHIINLVAQQVLFGSDPEDFEIGLDFTVEELEMKQWRSRGPIGKPHNLMNYVCHSTKRREAFKWIQQEQPASLRERRSGRKDAYDLIHDNLTRWNSWFDAAERAFDVRQAIDHFVDQELDRYNMRIAVYKGRLEQARSQPIKEPKRPKLADDRLSPDDWSVIARYITILKPCKKAPMTLQVK